MSYEEIISFARENLQKTVSKNSVENTAVEFNIYGEGEGAFYIELKDGKVSLEPYEFYDRDAKIIITANELEKIIKREKTPDESFQEGNLTVEGNIDKARGILSVFKAPAKKTAAQKSTAKKTVKAEKQIVEKTKSKDSKIAKDIKK